MTEALRQRIIEVELRPQALNGLLVCVLTDHRLHRIAGRDVEEEECDDEDSEQRRHGEEQATQKERHQGLERRA